MFAEGYFSLSFAEVIGFVITIVSVWLVVRQLNETRLASQMEGLLALTEIDISGSSALLELINLDDWNSLSEKDAYTRVYESETFRDDWIKTLTFFELLGVLVRRKVLDKGLAYDQYGKLVFIWWERLEKVVRQRRIEDKWEELGEHWEWLAFKFEKLDS